MVSLKYIKYIVLGGVVAVFLFINVQLHAQNIDFDNMGEQIDKRKIPEYNNTNYRLLFSLGYKYVHWSYTVQRPSQSKETTGSIESIQQSSGYQSLVINMGLLIKPTEFWDDIHLLFAMDIYFPLSISEIVYPAADNTGVKIAKINYLLKNTLDQSLKGIGFEWFFGVTRSIPQDAMLFLVGGGLATNVFVEDISSSKRKPRGTWGLGLGVNTAMQFRFSQSFGLQIGVKGAYYPITFIDSNNSVEGTGNNSSVKNMDNNVENKPVNYKIKTKDIINIGIDVSTIWYF